MKKKRNKVKGAREKWGNITYKSLIFYKAGAVIFEKY
jgi:hypothetical protein